MAAKQRLRLACLMKLKTPDLKASRRLKSCAVKSLASIFQSAPKPPACTPPPPPCRSGVHLIFEAEGSANPLDSPSILFVTVRDFQQRKSWLDRCCWLHV